MGDRARRPRARRLRDRESRERAALGGGGSEYWPANWRRPDHRAGGQPEFERDDDLRLSGHPALSAGAGEVERPYRAPHPSEYDQRRRPDALLRSALGDRRAAIVPVGDDPRAA